jgi:3-isopropylmalate dehydrogenase
MRALIAVLPGDGIGPEVIAAACAVLTRVARDGGHELQLREAPIGGAAIEACGEPLPRATLESCRAADAVLLGAVGGPRWDGAPRRPEQGLLDLRRALGLFANLRPVRVHPALADASPLRAHVLRSVDLLFVRELTGGIYFGARTRTDERAEDVCVYTAGEVRRVVRVAAAAARSRRGRLASVDKANVLATSRLWREVASEVVAREFPEVALEHLLVDAMAMHLVTRPASFDVIVTENLFGDILSDEAAALAGSIGLLPSASLRDDRFGLYEPIHGSAPDLAGRGVANPYGAILSAALLLRHSLGLEPEAARIEAAVARAIAGGARTRDLAGGSAGLDTRAACDSVLEELGAHAPAPPSKAPFSELPHA